MTPFFEFLIRIDFLAFRLLGFLRSIATQKKSGAKEVRAKPSRAPEDVAAQTTEAASLAERARMAVSISFFFFQSPL